MAINKGTHIDPMPEHCKTHMNMRIDKPRYHSFPLEINYFSFSSLIYERINHFAYKNNFSISDGNSLYFLFFFIHGVNFTITKNIVGVFVQEIEENMFSDVLYSILCQLWQFLSQACPLFG